MFLQFLFLSNFLYALTLLSLLNKSLIFTGYKKYSALHVTELTE